MDSRRTLSLLWRVIGLMPAGYKKMRDAFKKKGMSAKAAKTKAAKIWNSKHKGKSAVGRGRD